MNEKQIRKKIVEVEKLLEETEINIATADYYDELLAILHSLWDLLYFKINQEKDFLVVKEEEDEHTH